nr:unnamed protein product [Callosobruchus analis]
MTGSVFNERIFCKDSDPVDSQKESSNCYLMVLKKHVNSQIAVALENAEKEAITERFAEARSIINEVATLSSISPPSKLLLLTLRNEIETDNTILPKITLYQRKEKEKKIDGNVRLLFGRPLGKDWTQPPLGASISPFPVVPSFLKTFR